MVRFDFFKEMDGFSRAMDQMFRDLGLGRNLETTLTQLSGTGHYPRVNLTETADSFLVKSLLPGIDPKDLEINLLNGTLTLSGERKETKPEVDTWHRRERNLNKFTRVIEVPEEIDLGQVHADYQDGLLTITLPKAEKVKPKRIEITSK